MDKSEIKRQVDNLVKMYDIGSITSVEHFRMLVESIVKNTVKKQNELCFENWKKESPKNRMKVEKVRDVLHTTPSALKVDKIEIKK